MSTVTRQASARELTPEDERILLLGQIAVQQHDTFQLCQLQGHLPAVLRKVLADATALRVLIEQTDGLILELRERAGQFEYGQNRARAWVETAIASGQEEDFVAAKQAIAAIEHDPLEKLDLWLRMIEYGPFMACSIDEYYLAIEECEKDPSALDPEEHPLMDLYLAVLRREPEHDLKQVALSYLDEMPDDHHEKALAYVELCQMIGEYHKAAHYFATMETDLVKKLRILCRIVVNTQSYRDLSLAREAFEKALSERSGKHSYLQDLMADMIVGLCQKGLTRGGGGDYVTAEMLCDPVKSHIVSVQSIVRAEMALMVLYHKSHETKKSQAMRGQVQDGLRALHGATNVSDRLARDEMQRRFIEALVDMGQLSDAMRAVKRISNDRPIEQIKALAAIARANR